MRIRRRVRCLRSTAVILDWARRIWAFEVVALAALCFQEFFFPGFKLLFEGFLPGQKLLEFFLWLPSPSMVASDPQRGQF